MWGSRLQVVWLRGDVGLGWLAVGNWCVQVRVVAHKVGIGPRLQSWRLGWQWLVVCEPADVAGR